jgi:membrane protease YdiL (CAAX protease family)
VKEFLKSVFKILFLTIICYSLLFVVEIPFLLIFNIEHSNLLYLILRNQTAYIISGLIIMVISKYLSIYSNINFNLLRTLICSITTITVIILFCLTLFLLKIVNVNFYEISSLSYFGEFLIYCILPPLFVAFGEEFIFRWFLLNRLRAFLKSGTSIILGSIIFCLGHNLNLPNMLFAFISGCVLGLIYFQTNSIFNCIGIHAAWNFGQRFCFNGITQLPDNVQRIIELNIKSIDLYNWSEFFLGLIIFVILLKYFAMRNKSLTKEIPFSFI